MAKKLLIIGDSFSASTHADSWTNLLGDYEVTNLSMSGSSEYRLVKQLNDTDITDHQVIFVHTSANRIYVETNPYHVDSDTHKYCDLIFQDIHAKLPDPYAEKIVWWFENIFDLEQAEFLHRLLINSSMQKIPQALHLTFFDYTYPGVHNLHQLWQRNPGNINHMDRRGNQSAAEFIRTHL